MKRMYILLCIVLAFSTACNTSERAGSGDDLGDSSVRLDMDLSGARDLGYVITSVHVVLTHRGSGTTLERELDVADERATGTIHDVQVGIWDLLVELSDDSGVIGTGTGSVTVEAGTTAQAIIHISLGTGDIEIIVDWGSLPTEGLVAYYPFDGSAGDASGNGYDGSVFGAALAEDRFGIADSAFRFDGEDDCIELAGSAGFEFPSMTICAWAKDESPSLDHLQKMIVAKHVSTVHKGYCLYTHSEHYVFYVGHEGPPDDSNDTSVPATDSQWHFVVAIYDNGATSLYIDGHLEGSNTISGMTHSPVDVRIGCLADGGPWMHYWEGLVDDIRFYDRALGESEILALYREGGW